MGDEFYNENHTWPRGLKAKLIRLDGDRCFVCHCRQKPFAIHHFYQDGPFENFESPYSEENKYNPEYLILLCHSCHGKMHGLMGDSPFYQAVQIAFRERKRKLITEFK